VARVELRDINTDEDRAAALALELEPGQDRFVASVAESFDDAITYAHAEPRYWTANDGDAVVGFVMISDNIPAHRLAADPLLVGPYFLWRLLIDRRHQRKGYGTAAIDAVREYLRDRPGADALYTSAGQGEGSPQPFYERYGFVPTGAVVEDEVVLQLDLRDHERPGRAGPPGGIG
jgi:diamine N-acetyltransferase